MVFELKSLQHFTNASSSYKDFFEYFFIRIITKYNDDIKGLGHAILENFNAFKMIMEFNGVSKKSLKTIKKNTHCGSWMDKGRLDLKKRIVFK